MATIDFPNSPTVGQTFTAGNSSYRWTGTAWVSNNLGQISWNDVTNKPTSFTPSAHAASHAAGGSDPITIAPSQVSGVTISNKTAAYELVAGDRSSLIQTDGTFSITVPASTVPVGTRVDFVNIGTGTITFAGSGGLTVQSKGGKTSLAQQYAAATLFFTSNTTALLVGDLA
jgi:hypothetical protein